MNTQRVPASLQRFTFVLLSGALLLVGLYLGKEIILPLLFSALLANILLPVTKFLRKRRWNNSLSILSPVVLSVMAGAGLVYFLSSQVVNFIIDVPDIQERFNEISHSLQVWIRENTSITIRKQNQYLNDTVSGLKDKAPGLMGATFVSITGLLVYVVLMPLYTFLILYYRQNIKQFLINTFSGSQTDVAHVIDESATIAQRYLLGLVIETSLVFTLNMIAFLILGIKYAVFLALLAALLNLIPYVGMLAANAICMTITLASSGEVKDVVWVGVLLAFIQFLDNNFGMPLIVGNKVRINALVTIVGVLVGGALCGIPGMFLAIPGLAVLKVICDNVPELEPWGMLLGDTLMGNKGNKKK